MVQNLIAIVIVASAVFYMWQRWLRRADTAKDCGSACKSCSSGCETPVAITGRKVIPLLQAKD